MLQQAFKSSFIFQNRDIYKVATLTRKYDDHDQTTRSEQLPAGQHL